MKLVDLEPDDPRLTADVYPVLHQLRADLTRDGLADVYREGHLQGLRFLAAYRNERCVGVAGWRVIATTSGIRKLYVDDLVTDAHERGTGVGAALLAELRTRGASAGCRLLDLDSGVRRDNAHRFYMREGMTITSFHFVQTLAPPPHTPTE
jgi:GNAT superfamily N-acetyltransferase